VGLINEYFQMLPLVQTPTQKLEKYKSLISKELFEEIKKTAKKLRGLKIFHVNSTPRGGGVAEVLKSLIPLMRGVGLKAEWYINPPGEKFFVLTKQIHNALQGEEFKFPFSARKLYIRHMESTAKLMQDMAADLWVIHDPQPAGVIAYMPDFHPSIWRVHIDTSHSNKEAWEFIHPFMTMYDKIVFTSKNFIGPSLPKRKIRIFPPAIDPLVIKNTPLDLTTAKNILKSLGVNSDSPLITQVARFDPWKDPLGVVKAYRIAKKKIPNLQLALLGLFLARDDPEAAKVFEKLRKQVKNDPDVLLFSAPAQIGSLKVDTFVNAFQVASKVIIHKSIREGFGLGVTEAMWKGKPVVGGNVGGIKLQIKNGENGFLVSNPKEAAERIVQLIRNPELGKKLGEEAKKTVKRDFLMPRLLRDHLRLYEKLI
jgi:trehalose synthase